MGDGLLERLRAIPDYLMILPTIGMPDQVTIGALAHEAAAAIEARDAEIERLRAVVEHHEWGRENQRLTDADNDTEYEALRSRAEQAERALAEAVEVLRPFAEIREALELISAHKPGDVLQDERAIFQTWGLKDTPTSRQITLGHLRATRQFVKENGDET